MRLSAVQLKVIPYIIMLSMGVSIHWNAFADENSKETEIPDFDTVLSHDISPISEKLRILNEGLASSGNSWDDRTNSTFAEVNKACSTTNATIESIINPIGGIIGGALTNVNVTVPIAGSVGLGFLGTVATVGLTKGTEAVYEAITHEQEHQKELNSFIDNLKAYRDLTDSIQKIDGRLNATLALMKMIHDTGGRSALIQYFDRLNQHQDDIGLYLTNFIKAANLYRANQSLEPETQTKLEETIAGLEKSAAGLRGFRRQADKLIEALEGSNDEIVCQEMRDGIATLFDMEHDLLSRRKHLIDDNGQKGQELWLEGLEKAYVADIEKLKIDDTLNKNADKQVALAGARYVALLKANPEIQKQIDGAYKQCLKEKTGLPLFFTFLAFPGTKKECKKEVRDPNSKWAATYTSSCKGEMSNFCAATNQDIADIRSRNLALLAKTPKLVGASLKLYLQTKKNYRDFFDRLVTNQTDDKIAERNKVLETRREEIEMACSPPIQKAALVSAAH